jgi:hypothetical protein
MRNGYKGLISISLLLFTLSLTAVASAAPKDSANSIVITFKDGHQQTYSLADIARIEFNTPATASTAKSSSTPEVPGSRHHFVGKWAVGDGNGNTYYFTFEENGHATNNVGSGGQGAWTYVDGEARVSWDNGWHDIIRKVGTKYQKFAYSPGKSFNDDPYNVTDAHKTSHEPI